MELEADQWTVMYIVLSGACLLGGYLIRRTVLLVMLLLVVLSVGLLTSPIGLHSAFLWLCVPAFAAIMVLGFLRESFQVGQFLGAVFVPLIGVWPFPGWFWPVLLVLLVFAVSRTVKRVPRSVALVGAALPSAVACAFLLFIGPAR